MQSPVGEAVPRVEPTRGQRRPLIAVVAVLLILLGAAGAAFTYLTIGDTVPAAAARVPIDRGQLISEDMIATVDINPNQQLSYISPDEAATMVGQRAARDIAAGGLIGPDAAAEAMVPPVGSTVVGLSLPPGAEPGIPLAVGDRIRVVLTEPTYQCVTEAQASSGEGRSDKDDSLTSASGTACPDSVYIVAGQVVAYGRDEASGQVTVSVQVAEADAARAAAAAAMDRAALVLDSRDR